MKKGISSLIASACVSTSLIAAPQAIVFDFGGVLTGEPNREVVEVFIQESLLLSKEEYEKARQEKREALKLGKTDEDFWTSYAKAHGIELAPDWTDSLKRVMKEVIGVNPKMYLLVKELIDRQIPVAMLSNIDDRLAKLIRSYGLYEPFNPCLLSCEIGVEKPDLKAYEVLLSELNFPAKDIIFIDDRPENITAAKTLGIDAVLFKSEGQLRHELIRRGAL